MNPLSYIARANAHQDSFPEKARIALITNFTDSVLGKLLVGIGDEAHISITLEAEPYQQYQSLFADPARRAARGEADITFMLFDATPYVDSAFVRDHSHFNEIVQGIAAYAHETKGHVIAATFPSVNGSVYGNLAATDPLSVAIADANAALKAAADTLPALSLLDTDRLLRIVGEQHARDLRGSYAFDMPFTNDFLLRLAHEYMSYLFAIRGRAKKCLVLDLDNTLWGGVVGEAGTHGIALGPGYPGFAFQNVQRIVKDFGARGIILALASKNNEADVDDVFANNTNMKLATDDFAARQINWEPKSVQLERIATSLNIGIESLVFIDDDAANREEVRAAHPGVVVPEVSSRPEETAKLLLSLTCFNQLTLTAEDLEKNRLYAAERERAQVLTDTDYITRLGVRVQVSVNAASQLPRLAQLSQKTNQYNLTTHRYTEAELQSFIDEGALVLGADVHDRFGEYGVVVLAIAKPKADGSAELDTFLMSCRAMGRNVEYAVLDALLQELTQRGILTLTASYFPTAKNLPARDFLTQSGFTETKRTEAIVSYTLSLLDFERAPSEEIARTRAHGILS